MLKLWAVHFKSESGDHYYESFRSLDQPTTDALYKWWKTSTYGEDVENIYVENVWEVPKDAPVIRN